MIRFKSALDTLQAEIAERERQGIAPVPVQRRGLYKQADKPTVNKQPVNTVNTSTVNTSNVNKPIVNTVTETKKKPIKAKKAKADKTEKADLTNKVNADLNNKQVERVLALNTHSAQTLDSATQAKQDRKEYYRRYMADRRNAAKNTKTE